MFNFNPFHNERGCGSKVGHENSVSFFMFKFNNQHGHTSEHGDMEKCQFKSLAMGHGGTGESVCR